MIAALPVFLCNVLLVVPVSYGSQDLLSKVGLLYLLLSSSCLLSSCLLHLMQVA